MAEAFYRLLGGAIRRRRNAIGMTQATVASRAGLLRTTVANIERGRQAVLVHQLVDIARVLGSAPESLLPTVSHRTAGPAPAEVIPEQIKVLLERLDAEPHERRRS